MNYYSFRLPTSCNSGSTTDHSTDSLDDKPSYDSTDHQDNYTYLSISYDRYYSVTGTSLLMVPYDIVHTECVYLRPLGNITNLKHLENHGRQFFVPKLYDITIVLNMIWLLTRVYFLLHHYHHVWERIVCLSKGKRTFYWQLHRHFFLMDVTTRQVSIFNLISTFTVSVVDLYSHQELDLYIRQNEWETTSSYTGSELDTWSQTGDNSTRGRGPTIDALLTYGFNYVFTTKDK